MPEYLARLSFMFARFRWQFLREAGWNGWPGPGGSPRKARTFAMPSRSIQFRIRRVASRVLAQVR